MGSALGVAKTAAARIGCTVDEWTTRRADGERWCTGCRSWWSVENMYRDRSRPDGIGLRCRACTAGMFAARKKAARIPRPRANKEMNGMSTRPEGTLRDGDSGGSCPLMLLALLALPTGLTVVVWHALSAWL